MSEIQDFQFVRYDHNEQDLINAVNDIVPSAGRLRYDPFEVYQDSSPVISTILEVDNALQLKLNAYDDYFLDEDELLRDLNVKQLPSEMVAVAFELIFADYLRTLSDFLGHEVSFDSSDADKLHGQYKLFFSLNHNGRWLLMSLEIPDESSAHKFCDLLRGHQPSPNEDIVQHLSCQFAFDLGLVNITGKDLIQLRCGDILIPDHNYLRNDELCVNLNKLVLHFNFKDAVATYQGYSIITEDNQGLNMSDELNNNDDPQAAGTDSQTPLQESINQNDLSFEVAFELDRQQFAYTDVVALKRGSLVNLNCSPKSPVSLRINGRIIGSGRLVQLGDQIGVQITEIKQ
ncbi:MAG: FliM/FliN family flagellar motor switch protein [Succinivibrio sp.]|nr:FliM/FliN family flagellar motor switch protein [Succinivibrio sp.]